VLAPGNRRPGIPVLWRGCECGISGMTFGASLVPLIIFLIFHVSWRQGTGFWHSSIVCDRQKTGFQHYSVALIAVGIGGVTGTGLMEGKQKLFYLPEPHTDFIFAVTAEELGLVGAMAVVALFRGLFCGAGCGPRGGTEDVFGRYLGGGDYEHGSAAGILNMSVVLGHDAD